MRYLLAQQQDFGGWIQTTTHENFRTPMRETRYAVMALAEAFPRPGAPLRGWGNRDERPARLPRTDSLVHTLDDLENLWDVPEPDRARFATAIGRCSKIASRWSARRRRRAWADWASRLGRTPGGAGSPIHRRSSGAPRRGRYAGSETRGSAAM